MLKPGPADAFRLSQASVNEMLRPQVNVETGRGYSISWALGWQATHSDEFGDIIAHGWDQTGFHCLAELSVTRKSRYVLMTNGENGWKLIQKFDPELARWVHSVR